MAISVRVAGPQDAAELAAVAAETFPLACPPTADPGDIAAAIAANLSASRFAAYLVDPDRVVLVATDDGGVVGYSMLIRGIGDDPDVAAVVPAGPAVELSKMYVLAGHHRSGAATALMRSGIDWAAHGSALTVWLGVNRNNQRAQRFYRKHGFRVTGTRTFRLGSSDEADFVMVRPV
jgi:ribosomal protein S18 acetylase RimI-like enzyme